MRSAVTSDEVAHLMRDGISRMILTPVSQALGTPDARLGVSLVASQLIGLALARYVLEVEPLASATVAEIADRIAPVLQAHLTPAA